MTQPETRRVTIQDVAKAAGVSMSAVSKVLRQAYGVSPQMRQKVTEAIERLGYRPHAGARAMRGRSFTIGVLIADLGSPFQLEISAGIGAELEPSPYQEILIGASPSEARQRGSVEALIDRQVDGLILVAPWVETSWLEALGAKIPTVVIARHGGGDNFDTIVDDDYEGARLMVNHLVGLGHRRIVHTGHSALGLTPPHVLAHTARREGYVAAMRRHGLVPDVIETSYSEEGGHEAALLALAGPEPPTAVFAGADIAALGVLRAAEERGLTVPDRLSVTGYDNTFISTIGRVALTTIDQSGRHTGSISARLLLERIDGRPRPVHYIIAPRLIPRATSGPAPAER
ncbi:LacI family DNA-binding transcriptional regulator [Nonomuraea sp. NPDC049158]|uniref:LacI family DNA-binding transcriptional regulator n=1 Tax=Nonomuraea sp. NPDC049158 TaxID=3155649 RepID=UPI0033CBEB10